jgi:hypothetical protein
VEKTKEQDSSPQVKDTDSCKVCAGERIVHFFAIQKNRIDRAVEQ